MVNKKLFKWRLRFQLKARHLKKIHFGSPDKNLYDVVRIFIQQLKKDDISERAGAMAFSYTIALFPLMLFLLNMIPYLQDFFPVVTTENIFGFVQTVMPDGIYENIETTLMDIVSKPRQSLLSFGFFFALFASTQGVMSMMASFNSVYKTRENRGFLKARIVAVSIVFALVLTIFTASTVMIIGSLMINALDEMQVFNTNFMIFLFNTFKFLILLFVFYITSAFIFRLAPAVHDKWKFFSVGARLSGFLITVAFYAFIFYLNNFASYNKLYGSIGTFIALMLWLWITSLIVLVCFEVNVSLDLAEEKQRERENRRKMQLEAQKTTDNQA
ncbi:MAG: YihY/virulence factor BrkB family protein [Algoriphagus sp.]|uniref:YihY/virulence factor BrkB family protein n=1 Tax=Algoriphagus sp. TaxID=1872435 RepID=UPI00272142B4|nr:YihY/virulence factor BrkB family protein [Algoriphagus sp.]MDO8969010.1 YihY/virulence factor BrkB family protein [Algoriphagus sp.]MDP2041397.1 YihY/virulence factor BrkB family protein [Algoriphagus sp.]MDP3200240.1 YihY/virulence factor BrkB family protein [Algoriphagus sp.]MDP3473703.1 YihY/virulence factor BrkB family protein [Algoriphagus sp.]